MTQNFSSNTRVGSAFLKSITLSTIILNLADVSTGIQAIQLKTATSIEATSEATDSLTFLTFNLEGRGGNQATTSGQKVRRNLENYFNELNQKKSSDSVDIIFTQEDIKMPIGADSHGYEVVAECQGEEFWWTKVENYDNMVWPSTSSKVLRLTKKELKGLGKKDDFEEDLEFTSPFDRLVSKFRLNRGTVLNPCQSESEATCAATVTGTHYNLQRFVIDKFGKKSFIDKDINESVKVESDCLWTESKLKDKLESMLKGMESESSETSERSHSDDDSTSIDLDLCTGDGMVRYGADSGTFMNRIYVKKERMERLREKGYKLELNGSANLDDKSANQNSLDNNSIYFFVNEKTGDLLTKSAVFDGENEVKKGLNKFHESEDQDSKFNPRCAAVAQFRNEESNKNLFLSSFHIMGGYVDDRVFRKLAEESNNTNGIKKLSILSRRLNAISKLRKIKQTGIKKLGEHILKLSTSNTNSKTSESVVITAGDTNGFMENQVETAQKGYYDYVLKQQHPNLDWEDWKGYQSLPNEVKAEMMISERVDVKDIDSDAETQYVSGSDDTSSSDENADREQSDQKDMKIKFNQPKKQSHNDKLDLELNRVMIHDHAYDKDVETEMANKNRQQFLNSPQYSTSFNGGRVDAYYVGRIGNTNSLNKAESACNHNDSDFDTNVFSHAYATSEGFSILSSDEKNGGYVEKILSDHQPVYMKVNDFEMMMG